LTNKFGISEEQMKALVAEALKAGGSWCDLYFEDSVYCDLLLRDSEVSSGGFHEDYGCGIRVLDGEKTGYAYSETTDYPSLLQAARAAGTIGSGTGTISFRTAEATGHPYSEVSPWLNTDISKIKEFLLLIEQKIRSREARTVKVIAMLSYCVSDIMMYNSLGELRSDHRPLGSVSVSAIFIKGYKTINQRVSRSFRCGAELISESLAEELAAEATERLDDLFEAKRPKGGRMSLVMGAGASGILLHEAMGHAFEADFNRKGQSIFSDKFGKQICKKGINIVDDGTLENSRGACLYDDEGVPGQKTYMVTDGVLTSYLHDRISAAHYGVAPTGNGRRESFRHNPIPRMRATYMESGTDGTKEDLIASVSKGIFVDQFANGQVKIGEGDFTFFVKRGYLIEHGRLTMPVSDINIIGNGPQALADIKAVASDLEMSNETWTCGKEQDAPVSCGIPSVLISNLTIGGE